MLKLDTTQAKQADQISASISETGKYTGTITRAERLVSSKGTQGLGLSFKTDNGLSADYLDLYHTKGNGDALSSYKTVMAIMCCLKLKELPDSTITVEKWVKAKGGRDKVTVPGYPAMMGKRIGLLLRKTLETDDKGNDRTRMEIFGVFNPDTELTASEILSGATSPERLPAMLDAMMARPVIDKREHAQAPRRHEPAGQERFDDIPDTDDIPF